MRIAALDLLRGLAAIAVASAHFFLYAGIAPTAAETISIMAVEVFFALSGYVLAPQILRVVANRSTADLGIFLARRWMRTVPAFLLALSFSWVIFSRSNAVDLARYALYVQNLTAPSVAHDYFAVAWSLAVEEWFYLVFPAFLLAAAFITGKPWQSALGFITMVALARFSFAPSTNWDEAVRRVTVFRIDAIAWGFLFFIVSTQFRMMSMPRTAAIVVTITGVVFTIATYSIVGHQVEVYTPLFPFLAAAFSVSAVWFATTMTLPRWLSIAAAMLGRTSYSIYLFHSIILAIVFAMVPSSGLRAVCYGVATIAIAALVARFVEQPFLDARPDYREKQIVVAPATEIS
jgi:peptidoglycan/LPS O-acetylase OafA/YrhL